MMIYRIRVRLKLVEFRCVLKQAILVLIVLTQIIQYSFEQYVNPRHYRHLPYALRQPQFNFQSDQFLDESSPHSTTSLPIRTKTPTPSSTTTKTIKSFLNSTKLDSNYNYGLTKDYSSNKQTNTKIHNALKHGNNNKNNHHRSRHRINRNSLHQSENNNKKSNNNNNRTNSNSTARKRTILNNEYNLQRDYIAATIGKEVQLDCKMKNLANDDDKIVWLKMPKGEVLTLNGNRVTQDPRINSKCSQNQVPCWSLVITDTRESDTGFYVCQTNAMQTKYIYLDIMVPPKLLINHPIDRIDVNQSSNASITCEFYGKPEPLIKWYKYQNGNQKEMEKYRGHKTINLYIHKDSPVEFECVADNSIPPTVSKKIYLNIQYAPQVKFLNSKVFQKKGERVIFDCNVHGNPKPKIYWFKNQTRLIESAKYNFETLENNFHRLYINNLTDIDFTDYFITAINLVGKSSAKIELGELPTQPQPQIQTLNDSPPSSKQIFKQLTPETVVKVSVKPKSFSINYNSNNNNNLNGETSRERFMTSLVESTTEELFLSQSDTKTKNLRNSYKVSAENEKKTDLISETNRNFILITTTSYTTPIRHRGTKIPSYRSNKLLHSNQTLNHHHHNLDRSNVQRLKNQRKNQIQNHFTTTTPLFDLIESNDLSAASSSTITKYNILILFGILVLTSILI